MALFVVICIGIVLMFPTCVFTIICDTVIMELLIAFSALLNRWLETWNTFKK